MTETDLMLTALIALYRSSLPLLSKMNPGAVSVLGKEIK